MTKTQDDYLVDCILANQALAETKETLALVQDTISIALTTAGYNTANMSTFDMASAIQGMAQELAALAGKRQCNAACGPCQDDLCANYKEESMEG